MEQILHYLSIIGSALFMIIFFGLCVFIHELGHFLAAKWRGMRVLAFSIGFKKIWAKKIGDVEYRIGCIPFGGYVEIPQIDSSGDALDENGKVLPKAKPLDRIIAVFAGPLFNIIFGFLLGVVIWIHGIPKDSPDMTEFKVAAVEQESPEYKAGLRDGDVIYKLNGKSFNTSWNGFIRDILFTIGDVKLTVKRGGETHDVVYKPAVNPKIMPEEGIAYPFFIPDIPVYLYPEKNSPAEKAGILYGDKLAKVNGKQIFGIEDLEKSLISDGSPVDFTVIRNGKELEITGIVPQKVVTPGFENGMYQAGLEYSPETLVVSGVRKGMPAEQSGIRPGDRVVSINGKKLSNAAEMTSAIRGSEGKPLAFGLVRGSENISVQLVPRIVNFHSVGISYAIMKHPTPWAQFENVIVLTWKSLRGIGVYVQNKLGLSNQYTTIQPKHMSGPIGIGKHLFISVYKGSLIIGINLVVLITFNLGMLNLLPIPVLDGGHIMLALYEMIFKRAMPEKVLKPITFAFVAVLISFMLLVTYFDTQKILHPLLSSKDKAAAEQTQKPEPVKVPAAQNGNGQIEKDTPDQNR